MKLTIDTPALADATQWALRAIPTHPPTPVLAGMRIEAHDGTLTLAGFDYYRSARAHEACDASEPGTVLVPGRVLADLVRTFPKTKPTDLSLDGTDLTLSCGTAHITLPTLPLEDYPSLPDLPAASGTITGGALAQAITRVAAAAGTDQTLPQLTGVEVALHPDQVVLSATDRYHFHVAHVPWTPSREATPSKKRKDKALTEGQVIVPADVLRDAARILADTDQATLTITDSQFAVSVPGRSATGGIINGDFPRYAALFPTELATVAQTSTEDLTTAIRHLTPLLGKSDPMILDITDGQIHISAGTSDNGRGRDQVDATLTEGSPLTIAFNPGLLLATLQQVDDPVIQMSFTTPTKPAVLHAPDDADTFRGLIMPIRLSS
ncbi:DNA polymerase III subunit beta [Streptomyces viridiviolaceus]|uniref:Beta sliding clamp n=1 Tax=Streptomyces viridiviolaceus TaxID=68282 RepID=A0ABW2ECB8_9ACTN|nr:DNA polymerase III subunit beta [Streptomyces viridiviolaceus]GHB68075.1 DNA polymerase III subunit beta [Streptomyces viridiviolaceus]